MTDRPATGSLAARVLDSMTLAQRAGQLFVVGMPSNHAADDGPALRDAIERAYLGSVYLVQSSALPAAQIRRRLDRVQALATPGNTAGAGLLVGVDQEGGRVQRLYGHGFSPMPSAEAQGQMAPDDLRAAARRWAAELAAAGVNLDFAPVADVVPAESRAANRPIARLNRAFGATPTVVADHVAAFVAGMIDGGVATCLKHFPGLGRVAGNTDHSAGVTDGATTADDGCLAPFAAGIAAGASFVMVSLASYGLIDPGRLAVFSSIVIGDLLRGQLGFDGVVVSDELGQAKAVRSIPERDRAIGFLEAGGDLIVVKRAAPAVAMAAALVERAQAEPAFEATISRAAARVLRAKERLGLLRRA